MNREQLQNRLHKMQTCKSYRLFIFEDEKVKTMPEKKELSSYLIMTDTEWFAKNGDQHMNSSKQSQNKILFAETHEELFVPTSDKTAHYVSPDHPAEPCCVFAYVLISEKVISAGFLGGKTTGKYFTIRIPTMENRCYSMLDLIMTIIARSFPDDVNKLRSFFNLSSKYNAGDETIFEE